MQAFCDCSDTFCLCLQHSLLLPLADVLQQNVLPEVAVIFASNVEIRETMPRYSHGFHSEAATHLQLASEI